MDNRMKVVATGIVWFMLMLIVGSAIWAPVAGATINIEDMTGIIFILAAAATISTGFIWAVWDQSGKRTEATATMDAKAKREQRDPRQRLLSTLSVLDDQEAAAMLDDLKARLHGGDSDGEISALEMLREERRQHAK
jgi:hypothetical protein